MTEPIKRYELTFEERPEFLYVHLQADATCAVTACEYWQKIIAKCREIKTTHLLVVREISNALSTIETFNIAQKAPTMGMLGIKVALVDPVPQFYELHQFGELVSNNRGVRAKVFTTVPEAEQWLLHEKPTQETVAKPNG